MSESSILTILGFFFGGGTVGALIAFWANRKKVSAETDNLVVEGAKALLEPLYNQLERMESDLCKEHNARVKIEEELEKVKTEAAKRSEANQERILVLEEALRGKNAEIEKLQVEANALKIQVSKQKEQISALEAQLEELKETPVTKLEKKKTGPLKDSSL